MPLVDNRPIIALLIHVIPALAPVHALDLIEGMRQAENMDELKDLFGKAYTMTKGTKLQSNVQAEYAKKKQQLEGVI